MKKLLFCATLVATMMSLQSCWPEENPFQGDGNDSDGVIVINGHECVDLGLSVKWATCNVGASIPEDYGDHFAWGETSPKENYTGGNCVTEGDRTIGDISGNAQYDAARANWGSSWRLPTKAERDELVYNCTNTWTTRNGVYGLLFTSKKNGNSIFLPAAGWRRGVSLNYTGENGNYWTATPGEDNGYQSYNLVLSSGGANCGWAQRSDGRSIRPVSE